MVLRAGKHTPNVIWRDLKLLTIFVLFSKPGASAVSTWLSNKVIGLDQAGYGTLMSEVTWTCTRVITSSRTP